MNTEIYFTIKTETETTDAEIEFNLQFRDNGECHDGESFNPTNGWTNYTEWHTGWGEEEETEELYDLIREYSMSMELEEIVAEMEITDVNYPKTVEYEGNTFTVTCTGIEYSE